MMAKEYYLYKVLRYLFDQLDIKITNNILKQSLKEQKKIDTIHGIIGVLDDFEIESKVYRVEYEDLHEIECPYIAHIKEDTSSFVVIKECFKDTIHYFDHLKGLTKESVDVFIKKWSGVILVPITSQQSGDPEYIKNMQEQKRTNSLKRAFMSLVALCLIIIIFKNIIFYYEQFLIWFAFILCKILGTIISVFIIKIEFGNIDPLVGKICGNYECEKILHSKASKLFSWLSMGDIGIIYFAGGLCALSMIYSDTYTVLNILIFLNYATLPYTFYSAFYQWKIAKAFCPFCCAVVILLWIEFVIGFFIGFKLASIDLSAILFIVISYLIIAILWFVFKSFLQKAFLTDSYKSIISGIKKDIELFKSITNSRLPVPDLSIQNEIFLGALHAPNIIIAVITPSCHSCFQLFSELRTYSQLYPERLKIILRFKGSDNEQSDMNKVIDWMISLHFIGETSTSLRIYESWNKMKLSGRKKWEEKNQLIGIRILPEAVSLRRTYNKWISSLDIPGVPSLIYNAKILPHYYTFHDIKYLLKHLNGN